MNNNWLDLEILEDYLDGKLDAKTMNMVEREALEDPFVAEALAGLSASPKRSLQSLSILQKQLQERISQQQITKKRTVITWHRLSIAAAAAVLFIAASIMFWFRESNSQKQLASVKHKKVEVVLAPKADNTGGEKENKTAKPVSSLTAANVEKSAVKRKTLTRPVSETEKVIAAAEANAYAANIKARRPVPKEATVARSGYPVKREHKVMDSDAQINAKSKSILSRVIEDKTAGISVVGSAQNAHILSGRVTDRNDGKPLPGVMVGIEGTGLSTVSDVNGEFKINTDTILREARIIAGLVGFETAKLQTKTGLPVSISLEPVNQALNEVVIGYGTTRNERTDYILKNNKFANEPKLHQSVELAFNVNKEGNPTNIKVTKSLGKKYDEEAVRLIKGGPKWKQPQDHTQKVTFSIEF